MCIFVIYVSKLVFSGMIAHSLVGDVRLAITIADIP